MADIESSPGPHDSPEHNWGSAAVHDVLVSSLEVLVEYCPDVETWYGDSLCVGNDPEIIDSVHLELLVSWRARYDRVQMLAEIALESQEPWGNLSTPMIREATRSIYDHLKQIRDYRRYVAEMMKRAMYTSDEDADEMKDFYILPALQDVRKFQRGMRLLKAPKLPLKGRTYKEIKPQQHVSGSEPAANTSREEPVPEHKKSPRQIAQLTTRGHIDFSALDTAAFAVTHWVTDDCLNRLAKFLQSESLSVLISASPDTQSATDQCPWREQLRLLWLKAFDTLRRVAAVVLFDIDDPLDSPTTGLVRETGTCLLDFAAEYRDFRKVVLHGEPSPPDTRDRLQEDGFGDDLFPKSLDEWTNCLIRP